MGVDADNSFLAKDISRIKAWESGINWRFLYIGSVLTRFVYFVVRRIVRVVLSANSGEDVEVFKEIADDCG
jgi:hypothetical protein